MLWLLIWSGGATALYVFAPVNWLAIPWGPISVIGIAVSFFVGFKNNQSYDRMWETRKIWGAIVNDSRAWASLAKGFVSNLHSEKEHSEEEIHAVKTRLIHRHIAWLYTLRRQLLIPTEWERVSQGRHIGKVNEMRRDSWGAGKFKDVVDKVKVEDMMPREEFENMHGFKNQATYLIDMQTEDLKKLREQGLIDDFRHMEMQQILTYFYTPREM